jgi:transcriptional regulator with XRE-family HTH domain
MAFKDRLKSIREAAGLSQDGLAKVAGMSTSGVAKLERMPGGPSWETLLKLAKALRASLDDFLDDAAPSEAKAANKPTRKGK